MGLDIDFSGIADSIWQNLVTSTNAGVISSSVILASLYGNWYLYKKLGEYKDVQDEYEKIFIVLEPILTKIVNGEKITPAEIDDVKQIRSFIKFKFVKK